MAFYAAPLHDAADAALAAGYTPPAGMGGTVTLSSTGIFDYMPPLHGAANATLESGYTPGTSARLVMGRSASPGTWAAVPTLRVWLGTAWVTKPLKQFNGAAWVPAALKRYRP